MGTKPNKFWIVCSIFSKRTVKCLYFHSGLSSCLLFVLKMCINKSLFGAHEKTTTVNSAQNLKKKKPTALGIWTLIWIFKFSASSADVYYLILITILSLRSIILNYCEESHISSLKLQIAHWGALFLQAGLSVPEHIFWHSTYPRWMNVLCPTAETLKITIFFIS